MMLRKKGKKFAAILLASTLSLPFDLFTAIAEDGDTLLPTPSSTATTDTTTETDEVTDTEGDATNDTTPEADANNTITTTTETEEETVDFNADVETEADWEKTFSDVELTGIAGEDLVAIAKTQLGYTESKLNYVTDEDDETVHGYTRYGAWAEDPYSEEWNTLFAAFCVNYTETDFLIDAYASDWVEDLQSAESMTLWSEPEDWNAAIGDLVFFDTDEDGIADRVGIVESTDDTDFKTIEGDVDGKVDEVTYKYDDEKILGYGLFAENAVSSIDDGIMLLAQSSSPYSETGLTVNYYAFIDDERVLWKTETNVTAYYWNNRGGWGGSSSSRRYLSAKTLANAYSDLGFDEDMLTSSTYYFPYASQGSSTIYGNTSVESYSSWYSSGTAYYSPIITGNTTSATVDVYYFPNQSARSSYGNSWSNYTSSSETFYTVTVTDPDNLVYGGAGQDAIPEVTYTLKGKTATVSVKNKDGVQWICKGQNGSNVSGAQSNGYTTFAIYNIAQPYTVFPGDASKSYSFVTYNLNLPETPADTDYGTPKVGGSSTSYTDIAELSGDRSYTLEAPSVTTYYYTHGSKYRGFCTFLGWSTSSNATTATYTAGQTITLNSDLKLYAVWKQVEGGTSDTTGSVVNFFVALNAVPEGTSAWSGATDTSAFTDSVYAMDCGVTCSDAINYGLRDSSGYVLGGTSGTDLNATHNTIVTQLTNGFTKTGTYGRTYSFKGTFPTDEEVLRAIRIMVNNGTKITLNNHTCTADELTAQNFTIKWYVFFPSTGDAWHIDGILVAKSGTLKVVKTFGGEETAVKEVKKQFNITVNGTSSNDSNIVNNNYTLNLNPSSETNANGYDAYDEESDTYTWYVKTDQFYEYNVEESNYSYSDKDITTIAEYQVSNSVTESENTNGWQTYSGNIPITGQAYDSDDVSSVQTVSFLNTYSEPGTLIIQKKDSSTGELIPGVQFQVLKTNDSKMQLYQTSEGHYASTATEGATEVTDNIITTDKNGRAFLTIKDGTYQLDEQVVGYNDPGMITVTVENGSEEGVRDKIVMITDASSENKYNDASYVDYVQNTLTLNITNVSPVTEVTMKKDWTDEENSPVTLQLYRNGESMGTNYKVTLDGKIDSKEKTPWQISFDKLPIYVDGAAAKYSLVETNIGGDSGFNYSSEYPDGYKYYDVVTSNMVYHNSSGNEVDDPSDAEGGEITITCSNSRSTAEVYFQKVDSNGKAIQGAQFYLYKLADSSNSPDANAEITFNDTESEDASIWTQSLASSESYTYQSSAVSDENGKVSFGSKLADGYYYLVENSTSRAYELAKETLWLIRKDGSEVTLRKREINQDNTCQWTTVKNLKITNEDADLSANITITKVQKDNITRILPGVEFTLQNSTGKYYTVTDGTVSWSDTEYTLTTGEDGKLSFSLPEGTYLLTETSTLDGYSLLTKPVTIQVDSDGKVTSFLIEDEETVSSGSQKITADGWNCTFNVPNSLAKTFSFIKVDKDKIPLSGAYFALYKLNNTSIEHDATISVDSSGNLTGDDVNNWTLVSKDVSRNNGYVLFEGLRPSGIYRLVEYKPPDGYQIPSGQWELVYDSDNEQFSINAIDGPPAFEKIENDIAPYRVANYKPTDIPSSGSIGIKDYLMIGGITMAIGVIWIASTLYREEIKEDGL